MTIYVYPADEWGCGNYRMRWPAEYCGRDDVRIIRPTDRIDMGGRVDKNGDLFEAYAPDDAEAIVLQRPTNKWLAQAVPQLRALGIAVIIDMDDDLARIHPANQAFHFMHPDYGDPMHSWHNAAQACRDATLVTVSTPQLARRYGAHGRVAVLPNYVTERFCSMLHEDNDDLTWCGSLHSHPNDLHEVGGAVAQLAKDYTFRVIGVPDGIGKVLGMRQEYIDGGATGSVQFENWAAAIAQSGVTMAPLADTSFNSAKSWLKPLEAMAVGVPVAVSDRIEYRKLVELTGVGTIVHKPKLWEKCLRRLLESPSLRMEQSAAGRSYVRDNLTYEKNGWRWAETWQTAIQSQKALVSQ